MSLEFNLNGQEHYKVIFKKTFLQRCLIDIY